MDMGFELAIVAVAAAWVWALCRRLKNLEDGLLDTNKDVAELQHRAALRLDDVGRTPEERQAQKGQEVIWECRAR
jgi:hypothetical protein